MGEHEQAPPQLPAVSSWQPQSTHLALPEDTTPPVTFTPPWDESHLGWTDLSPDRHLFPHITSWAPRAATLQASAQPPRA